MSLTETRTGYWQAEAEKYRRAFEDVTGIQTRMRVVYPGGETGQPLVILHPVKAAVQGQEQGSLFE